MTASGTGRSPSPASTTCSTSGEAATASATAPANSGVATTARAPESATIEASSRPVNIVESGTATRPARKAPRIVVSIGTSSAMTSTTRSSRCKPSARRPAATSPTRRSRSAYVQVVAARTAVRSPRPAST